MDMPSTIEDQILAAIRRIIRAIDLHSRQLTNECGLTGPQLATLTALARGDAGSARDLARTLQISQPTVAGILERLERGGYIMRERNTEDRRSVDVTVSPRGQAVIDSAPPLLQKRFCAELAKLAAWERTMILMTLQRVASMMNADELEAAPHLVTGAEQL